jgi:hypothetical protein
MDVIGAVVGVTSALVVGSDVIGEVLVSAMVGAGGVLEAGVSPTVVTGAVVVLDGTSTRVTRVRLGVGASAVLADSRADSRAGSVVSVVVHPSAMVGGAAMDGRNGTAVPPGMVGVVAMRTRVTVTGMPAARTSRARRRSRPRTPSRLARRVVQDGRSGGRSGT